MSKQIRDELKKQTLAQIAEALNCWKRLQDRLAQTGPEDTDTFDNEHITSSIRLAIERVCPPGSTLVKQMETLLSTDANDYVKADKMMAIATTLETSLQNDWLVQFEELIHGELFCDFLDMAEHLLKEGYKDAAAVIAGSSLESHLRQLCIEHNLPLTVLRHGTPAPKTAANLNDDLRGANVYDASTQKLLSSFIDTRNDAAHGRYVKYDDTRVKTMIAEIRSFLQTHPA